MSNLLPKSEQKAVLRLYRTRVVIVALGLLTVLILISAILLVPSLVLSKNQEEILRDHTATLLARETSGLSVSLGASVTEINTRLGSFLETSTPATSLIETVVDPILLAQTEDISITSIYVSGGVSIDISGIAENRASLLIFADNLRAMPEFLNVNVPIESFIKETSVPFAISVTLAGLSEE